MRAKRRRNSFAHRGLSACSLCGFVEAIGAILDPSGGVVVRFWTAVFPILCGFILLPVLLSHGQTMDPRVYDMGSPTLTDIWVDPANGDDASTGADYATALRTLTEAWNRVPAGAELSGTGYRIQLAAGDYPESSIPAYLDRRHGTFQFPVILNSANGPLAARMHGYLNVHDCTYLYIIGLDLVTDPGYGGGGNVIHYDSCTHCLLRQSRLNGFDGSVNQPQETLKANQCQYLYVEDSEICGAYWFALDFMVVQYGHVVGCNIHHSEDDCLLIKGGASYMRIEGNEVHHAGVIGITVGQGSGFDFMVSPWLHYECYDVKVVNNVVHDVQNAGLAVRGSYNVLVAQNTLYRVGLSPDPGGPVLLIGRGERSCVADAAGCTAKNAAGGWGPTTAGAQGEWIPCRNVYVYNNIFYNPAPAQTRDSHFVFAGPATPPEGTNIPSPSNADDNLRIWGNLIWNGTPAMPLGIGPDSGCQPSNPACNETLLLANNTINQVEPQLIDPAGGNFRLAPGSNVLSVPTFVAPDFVGGDRPAPPVSPEGNLANTLARDFDQHPRGAGGPPGAFAPYTPAPTPTPGPNPTPTPAPTATPRPTLTPTPTPAPSDGPDLTGAWQGMTQKCGRKGCRVKGAIEITNEGSTDAGNSTALFYLSADAVLDSSDEFLKGVPTGKMRVGRTKVRRLNMRRAESVSGSYILAVLDGNEDLAEMNEANNVVPIQVP